MESFTEHSSWDVFQAMHGEAWNAQSTIDYTSRALSHPHT